MSTFYTKALEFQSSKLYLREGESTGQILTSTISLICIDFMQ